ncbi:calcium/sodium antiporter [Dongshaea marina]|uniref:calcium/sodium antiporter n=1 Tax=Dongshaea marina TaxID=2047966 RepID=UPI000D3E1EC3|nr:calcium/sodium antiporter [Dongshaea marina]
MLISSILLIIGFILLIASADRFVYGAAAIARNFGIPPLVIGLTIVAMGSSAPEIMVSAMAAIKGQTNTAIGNAIGSNITNITLVLGLTALLKPMTVSSGTLYRELPLVVLTSLLGYWVLRDNYLSRPEGWTLMALFFGVMLFLVWYSLRTPPEQDPIIHETEEEVPAGVPTLKALLWLVVGIIVLPLSANLLVDSATDIARYFGISDLVIGLTIVAIGTSLPELAACVISILRKEDDLALGNIIGSNIFNILAVMSLPGIIRPDSVDPHATSRDLPYMIFVSGLLFLMAISFRGQRRINRWEGMLLLLSFVAYQWILFYNRPG